MKTSGKYLWPAAAILIGGIAAWFTQATPPRITAAYSASTPVQVPAQGVAPQGEATEGQSGERIQGKVLETIVVPNYVYLRIGTSSPAGEVWAAVASADVNVGQSVSVVGAQRMQGFTSSTLKRTFDVIYFGSLGGGASAAGTKGPGLPGQRMPGESMPGEGKLPPGHPALDGSANPHHAGDPASMGQGPTGAGDVNPHAAPQKGGDQVPVGKVERAKGKLGHSVVEVVRGRQSLAGQRVRVRGVVVKSISGVMGKTFAHLRDGSGNADHGDHDLTITTEQAMTVGTTVLIEGNVVVDKDLGAGYSYPVLLEDAQVVTE